MKLRTLHCLNVFLLGFFLGFFFPETIHKLKFHIIDKQYPKLLEELIQSLLLLEYLSDHDLVTCDQSAYSNTRYGGQLCKISCELCNALRKKN